MTRDSCGFPLDRLAGASYLCPFGSFDAGQKRRVREKCPPLLIKTRSLLLFSTLSFSFDHVSIESQGESLTLASFDDPIRSKKFSARQLTIKRSLRMRRTQTKIVHPSVLWVRPVWSGLWLHLNGDADPIILEFYGPIFGVWQDKMRENVIRRSWKNFDLKTTTQVFFYLSLRGFFSRTASYVPPVGHNPLGSCFCSFSLYFSQEIVDAGRRTRSPALTCFWYFSIGVNSRSSFFTSLLN